MKKTILLFLYFSFSIIKSQANIDFLYNDWYLVKLEMRDGSKPFLKYKNQDNCNFNFVIEHNNKYALCNTYSLFNRENEGYISFRLTNNKMITSLESSLNIEKLTKDSLILSQNILGFEKKDLQKYYLIPKNTIFKRELEKNINKDTLVANYILSPKYLDKLSKRTIKDLDYKKTTKPEENPVFRFNGFLLLDRINKSAKVTLKDFNKDSLKFISKAIKDFEKYNNWEISNLKDFKYIKIPFSFISYNEIKKGSQSFGQVFQLFSLQYDYYEYGPTINQLNKSTDYYKRGLEAYENKNLVKAAEYFELSFKENKYNLDAYYNYSAIKFELNLIEDACKTWKFLKDEGQKDAETYYNEKCIKK